MPGGASCAAGAAEPRVVEPAGRGETPAPVAPAPRRSPSVAPGRGHVRAPGVRRGGRTSLGARVQVRGAGDPRWRQRLRQGRARAVEAIMAPAGHAHAPATVGNCSALARTC
eukprot:15436964-Alexandrium_andersonii.AAC.1